VNNIGTTDIFVSVNGEHERFCSAGTSVHFDVPSNNDATVEINGTTIGTVHVKEEAITLDVSGPGGASD